MLKIAYGIYFRILFRNPVNFEEADCSIIKHNKSLNPNNPKDAEIISKILEESDENKKDKDFELPDLSNESMDSILFTQEELWTFETTNYRKSINHDPLKYDRIQTRSQTTNKNICQKTSLDKLQEYADKIEEIKDRNDSLDKESNIEDDKSIDRKDLNIRNNENQMSQVKPTIIDIQIFNP